jgi:hypothetical protein
LPVITLENVQDILCTEVPGSASLVVTNLIGLATYNFSDPVAIKFITKKQSANNTQAVKPECCLLTALNF